MIVNHSPIDIVDFANRVKTALLQDVDAKVYHTLGEIEVLPEISNAYVNVTVVSVYFESVNVRSATKQTTLIQSVYEIFSENTRCRDVQTFCNYVVAVFDTPFKNDIDDTLDSVGKINALFTLMNKTRKQPSPVIKKGVGMVYGQVLLSNCSRNSIPVLNWSGETFMKAVAYSKDAVSDSSRVFASFTIFNNLKEDYQKLFSKDDEFRYVAYPVNIAMDKWIKSNI